MIGEQELNLPEDMSLSQLFDSQFGSVSPLTIMAFISPSPTIKLC
jgi:hypothetical protein